MISTGEEYGYVRRHPHHGKKKKNKLNTGYVCNKDCMNDSKKCRKCDLDKHDVAFCSKGRLPGSCLDCCVEVNSDNNKDVFENTGYECNRACVKRQKTKCNCNECYFGSNDRAFCEGGKLPKEYLPCCDPVEEETVCIKKSCSAKCEAKAVASCQAKAVAKCKTKCGHDSMPHGIAQSTTNASAEANSSSSATVIGGGNAFADSSSSASASSSTSSGVDCDGNSNGLVLTITCPQCNCCGECVAEATAECCAEAAASCVAECKV